MTIKVLIAEDHTLVSEGLQLLLSTIDDFDLIGTAVSSQSAIDQALALSAEVVLMDVNLGAGGSGIEATRAIKAVNPDVKVVILSMFTDPSTVAEAIKVGADGYLSKSSSRETVVTAIRDVVAGKSVLDPNVTEGIFGRIGNKDPRALTDREFIVLQALASGQSTREIAVGIHVSEETVKAYLKQIYRKLEVRDRTEAVAEAFRRGLVH